VKQALEFHRVQKENRTLVRTVKKQNEILDKLEKEHPGIAEVCMDEDGSILLETDEIVRKYEKGEIKTSSQD
jgi:hypothetical protein